MHVIYAYWHWLFTKNHFDIDCLYYRQGNEQKQVAVQPNLKFPSIRTPSLLKKISFNSVVEVFQDVLDKLSDVGEKGQAIEIL
jgi:hypothetical protein